MLEVPKGISHVPVKRVSGEENNSVCLLPEKDIERDSSGVYDRESIRKTPTLAEAHGVAIINNSLESDFRYDPGHLFWLHVDAKTDQHSGTVPVINLM